MCPWTARCRHRHVRSRSQLIGYVSIGGEAAMRARRQDPGDDNSPDGERDQTLVSRDSDQSTNSRHRGHHRSKRPRLAAPQRDARMASLNWYGCRNARPTAASTSRSRRDTARCGSMPGGRPFAWNPTASWPTDYRTFVSACDIQSYSRPILGRLLLRSWPRMLCYTTG